MELDTGTQLEDPLGLVLGVDGPRGGKRRDEHAGSVGLGEVPLRERVVDRDAGEPVALEALIWLAQRTGNVGGGHGDAQGLLLCMGRREDASDGKGDGTGRSGLFQREGAGDGTIHGSS